MTRWIYIQAKNNPEYVLTYKCDNSVNFSPKQELIANQLWVWENNEFLKNKECVEKYLKTVIAISTHSKVFNLTNISMSKLFWSRP